MKNSCPISKAANFLGSKWTLELIYYLQEPRRFCELQAIMNGLNPTTLSQRLITLEEEQIVQREVIPDSRPHVEYYLTDKGKDLLSVFSELTEWVSRWYPEEVN
jgi:DNA-binding HxlR family transcriptional regulator